MLPTLVRQVLARGIELGDVRSDLNLDDMAHVVSEVFVSDRLLELAVVSTRVGRRRAEPVVETLLHGCDRGASRFASIRPDPCCLEVRPRHGLRHVPRTDRQHPETKEVLAI